MSKKKPNPSLELEYWPIEDLVPYNRNPRLHSPDQVKQIARSIKEFGQTSGLVYKIDEDIRCPTKPQRPPEIPKINSKEFQPIKKDDHAMDALRYLATGAFERPLYIPRINIPEKKRRFSMDGMFPGGREKGKRIGFR